MSGQTKASGSLTLHLLETGATVATRFKVTQNGESASLFQIVDGSSGSVSPDWEVSPVRVEPEAYRHQEKLALSGHGWEYNGIRLEFGSDRQTADGVFSLEAGGALVIRKNLASATNTGNDVLTYTGKARLSETHDMDVRHSADVEITSASEGVYLGVVTPGESFLTLDDLFAEHSAELYLGASKVESYAVRWKIGDVYVNNPPSVGNVTSPVQTELSQVATIIGNRIKVSRAKVNGSALLVAEFYKGTTLVERACALVTDLTDDISIVLKSDRGVNIGRGENTVVSASLIRGDSVFTPEAAVSWEMKALTADLLEQARGAGGKELRSQTSSLAVSGADLAATSGELIVTADASW